MTRRRRTAEEIEQAAASLVLDQGRTLEEARVELGLYSVQPVKTAVAREEGRRTALAEPKIDRTELSASAQAKLDAAVRQYKRELDRDYAQRVRDEVRKRVDEIVLPVWKRQIEEAQAIMNRRKGIMDKVTFNKIRRCLHTDTHKHLTEKMLDEAFNLFMALEKHLLAEKESPTKFAEVPDNLAEWDRMRRPMKRSKAAIRPRL